MALYYPQANQKRPLILVGPPSIGRHELRLHLLEDKNRFAAAVPRKLPSFLFPSSGPRGEAFLLFDTFLDPELSLMFH